MEYQVSFYIVLPSGAKLRHPDGGITWLTPWKATLAQALGAADMIAMSQHMRADVKVVGKARR